MKGKAYLTPISNIKARIGINDDGRVQKYLTSTIANKMGKYVVGGTSGSVNLLKTLNKDSITYKAPYAHYQYIGKVYIDPNTGSAWAKKGVTKIPTNVDLKHLIGFSYWDRAFWASEKNVVLEELQKYIDRGTK